MDKTRMRAFIDAALTLRETITDEQALTALALYPVWKADVVYNVGQRVLYEDILYKVLKPHTSQAN